MIRGRTIRRLVRGAGFLFCALAIPALSAGAAVGAAARPDLVLITIDTLRADAPGCYGGGARTPRFDALAAAGTRFAQALSAVPLTLPSHATLLTGLDPLEHGLRDNGQGALAKAIPTLAERLRDAGYATIAVVGSRVLDRRFGLDRGFDLYDDRMTAERTGEFGYPERHAAEVVDVALAASADAARATPAKPLFLWVHFYDAHAPYEAAGADDRARYLGEVGAVDGELGRLLDRLSARRSRVVAIVGDHGEAFGEHGEPEHGYLLHTPTLAVPLVFAGTGVPAGLVVAGPVGIRRVAATLLQLAGLEAGTLPGPALKLAPRGAREAALPVYHETEFPASTFGWSPLAAVTLGDWRLVLGPRPALYDLVRDPGELENRLAAEPERTRALRQELARLARRAALAAPVAVAPDAELRRQLESLGYLSGASASGGTTDPAEGLVWLADFEAAKRQMAGGDVLGARSVLRRLVSLSPRSVPFLAQLARAEEALGDTAAARTALGAAAAANPQNEFVRVAIGELELRAGRPDIAEAALRQALAIQPRSVSAALALGELLARSGRAGEEEAMLRAAIDAGTASALLLARLGEIELRRGDLAGADRHLREAVELLPEFGGAWTLWAEVARRQGDTAAAAERAAHASR